VAGKGEIGVNQNSCEMKVIDINVDCSDVWVSYVGVVTTILRSLGIKCDLTDVAGMSGYAFIVNIHPELLPTGPVEFDWNILVEGTRSLGIEIELVAVEGGEDDLFMELFTRVKEEIDSGNCCIVWGAGDAPEFGLVCGYREQYYLVQKQAGVRQEIRYNELKTLGRIAGIFFGESFSVVQERCAREAIGRATKLLRGLAPCFSGEYFYGATAFRTWADAVAKCRFDKLGFIYNLMCYWELQMWAAGFCRRLAKRWQEVAQYLNKAGEMFARSFNNLDQIKQMVGEPDKFSLKNSEREMVVNLLKRCADFNESAVRDLERGWSLM